MSIQLLTAGDTKIEHSERHDLESFFWVLLYICTMFEGPGQRCDNGQRADPQHPFGHWLGKMDNLEEVGGNVITAYGIGSFRNSALGRPGGPRELLDRFVHPHFKPLIPMLEALCDKVFLIVKHDLTDATPMRLPMIASGDYDGVLDVLKTALNQLPPHDGPLPPPPSRNYASTLMPPPPGFFHTTSAVDKREPINWGSDSGYGGGETSRSGSLWGSRLTVSTGDMDGVGKMHRNNPSPDKTATARTTHSPTKNVGCSSSKRSNIQHVTESTSSTSSKRHRAGQL